MKKLQELKDLVQEAIDNGATSVDQIHKSQRMGEPPNIAEKSLRSRS